jgi:hypothetical protein
MSELIISLLLYLTALLVGFLIGRTTAPVTGSRTQNSESEVSNIDAKGSFFKPEKREKKVVKIDDSTFVTNVSSDSLEKKGNDLGTESSVEDDVGSSVSKLAQLKKK